MVKPNPVEAKASAASGVTSSKACCQAGRCVRHNDHGPECGAAIADLDTGACVHWFRVDGPVGELYDLGVVPGVVRPMALGFASSEILGLIPTTHFERLRRLRAESPNRASCQRPFRLSP